MSSKDSSSSSSDNNNDLNEFLNDFNNLDGSFSENGSESSNSDASNHRRECRKRRRDRMSNFNAKRKDVLQLFGNEKIRKTFRFDLASIHFIAGKSCFTISCKVVIIIC